MSEPIRTGRTATIDLLGLGERELERAVGQSVLIFDRDPERPAVYVEKVLRVDGRALIGQNALSLLFLDDQNQTPRTVELKGQVKFAMTYGTIRYGAAGVERGFDELHASRDSWIRYHVDKSWMPRHA